MENNAPKLGNENVMRYDQGAVGNEFYYHNDINFPIVANMDAAMLLLVNKILSCKKEGNEITFQTEGVFYNKRFFYRFFDYRATFDKQDRTRNICVKLTVCADSTIRVQAKQGFSVDQRESEMLVKDFKEPVNYEFEDKGDSYVITTSLIKAVVTKEPWNLAIYDKNGKELFRQFYSSRTDAHAVMKYEHCPFGFLYDLKEEKTYAAEQIEIRDDEHFYGFGEKFMGLDKKGQNIDLWNTNCLGCNTNRTYKNIPFFMSTKGYGIFMHTSNAINCNMGQHADKAYTMMTDDDQIDYFFIYGPEMKEIIPRYTDLTGKTPLPPKWSFGFWISKISYKTYDEVKFLEKKFREEEIPCDVIHLDTDWYEYPWVCDYEFSKNRFPNPEEMIKEAKEKGFRITLWQMPYIENDPEHPNKVYLEGYEKGYFAFKKDGTYDFAHGLIDFTNPDAVEWYKNKLLRPLLEMGVAAIKVDFGESIPNFYKYAGMDSDKMHNLYPLLYNKAVFEVTKDVNGEDQGVIWARSTWAGSQRYPLHWAGDPDVDFHALVATVKAGLSFGLSGFPFWSHDIGGFNAPAKPDVYARWMQVGCFSSHSRAHGFKTREPWDFGDEVKEISKKYLTLRYQLMPYIYSQAYKCTQTSLPMFRALVLEYQNDLNIFGIDNQYLFGDSFLVAPIMDATNERDAYLPAGKWTNYWTKEVIEGGKWIHIEAPLDVLPLYVRENAIIPMGKKMNYVDELPCDEITWDLYPVCGCASFDMRNSDGSMTPIKMCAEAGKVQITADNIFYKSIFKLNNVNAQKVLVNGKEVAFNTENNAVVFETEEKGKLEIVVE